MRRWVAAALCSLSVMATPQAAAPVSPELQPILEKAQAGDAESQFRLGSAYDSGQGVPRDGVQAMRGYRLAAEQGNAEAQNSVGSGLQAEQNFAEARTWYEKASSQQHAMPRTPSPISTTWGLGVPQDRQRALALYSTAADLGSAEAMWNIANLYGAGQLGAKDLVSACVWATRSERWARSTEMALKQAVAGATPFFRQNLSRAQYTRCIDDAMQWSPKHPPS